MSSDLRPRMARADLESVEAGKVSACGLDAADQVGALVLPRGTLKHLGEVVLQHWREQRLRPAGRRSGRQITLEIDVPKEEGDLVVVIHAPRRFGG